MPTTPRVWDWLTQQVPNTEVEWRARQTRLGLTTPSQYEDAIRDFIHSPSPVSLPVSSCANTETGEASLEALMTLTKRFSRSAQQASVNAAHHRAIAAFQRLILLSLCLILRDQGTPADTIDDIIVWLSPVQRVRQNCLKGILWVHQVIDALHLQHGWTVPRATELFFLVPLSASRLGEIHSIDVASFAKSARYCPDQTCLKPNYTLAQLVWMLCKESRVITKGLSLSQICCILGHGDEESSDHATFTVTGPVTELEFAMCYPPQKSPKRLVSTPASSGEHRYPKRRLTSLAPSSDLTNAHNVPSNGSERDPSRLLSLFKGLPAVYLSHEQLLQGLTPQKRWDQDGNVTKVQIADVALGHEVKNLYRSRLGLENEIQTCLHLNWLTKQQHEAGSPVYRLEPSVLDGDSMVESNWDGLTYLCYIFPREEALEPHFQLRARDLLPQFCAWFEYLNNDRAENLPLAIREQMIEICLGISRIQSPVDASLPLSLLDRMQIDDMSPRFRLDFSRARSVFLRLLGGHNIVQSNEVIESALKQANDLSKMSDKRIRNSVYHLGFSLAENAITHQEYDRSLTVISQFDMPEGKETWPELDFQLARQTLTMRALVYRSLGRFEEAAQVLEVCNRICDTHDKGGTHTYHVLRHRAELLCELRRPHDALELLHEPLSRLHRDSSLEDSRAHRRLCLANAEAAALCMQPSVAQVSLAKVAALFGRKPPEMAMDHLDHIRVYLVRMRLARYTGDFVTALENATEALELLERYHSVKGRIYYMDMVLKFRASIYLELARLDEQRLKEGEQATQHVVVGMGSYGREEILSWYEEAKQRQPL